MDSDNDAPPGTPEYLSRHKFSRGIFCLFSTINSFLAELMCFGIADVLGQGAQEQMESQHCMVNMAIPTPQGCFGRLLTN